VYFPWGLSHRGYRLADPAARRKAVRAASLLVGATVAIGAWTAHRLQPLLEPGAGGGLGVLVAPALLMALAIAGYALRVSRLVEGAAESDLQVPREQQLREAAELVDTRQVGLIGGLLAAMSGVAVWLQPQAWWLGAVGVAAGLGIVAWAFVLHRAERVERA